MNFRKILVALLSIALLFALAACGETAKPTETTATPVAEFDDGAMGMLYLSMDAEIKLTYDAEGLVTASEAANELGTDLLQVCPVEAGAACDVAVADLITAYTAEATADLKVILIKQAYGSESPSAKFLEDVRVDAEAVADGRTVLVVAAESLTAEGYIPAETIAEILKANAGEDANFTISETIVNGSYSATVEGDVVKNYAIDADTGRITFEEEEPVIETEPATDSEYYEPDEYSEPIEDPFAEELITEPIFEDDVMYPEDEATEAPEETTAEPVEDTEPQA